MKDRFTRVSKTERSRIRKEIRTTIYERDAYCCQFCRGVFPPDKLTIDHLIPLAKGGIDETTNYATACFPCNQKKADLSLHIFAATISIDTSDLPVTGDPIIDNTELPIQIRHLRKRIHDKVRAGEINVGGAQFQKKLEKNYRRDFWATNEGHSLEKEFPKLPGHVRIMLPEIRLIANSEREALLLIELAKSATTRNLIGNILTKGVDIEKTLIDFRSKSSDAVISKKIDQAFLRLNRLRPSSQWGQAASC